MWIVIHPTRGATMSSTLKLSRGRPPGKLEVPYRLHHGEVHPFSCLGIGPQPRGSVDQSAPISHGPQIA